MPTNVNVEIINDMNICTIQDRIAAKTYVTTEQFVIDVKWILHNCNIFYGCKLFLMFIILLIYIINK